MISEGVKVKVIDSEGNSEIEKDGVIERIGDDMPPTLTVRMLDHTLRKLRQGVDRFRVVDNF